MIGRTKKTTTAEAPGAVVARLQEQVRTAQALAAIPEQGLLEDARLNPTTRGRADELTSQRLAVELDMHHRRALRRVREDDRVEEEQARADRAVAAAREATAPARSVLELTRARIRYARGGLAASVACSIGSAMGVEALASSWQAPGGVGYLAEVAMTGMATAAIAWRGGLARSGATLDPAQEWLLRGLIAAPLVASIVASTAGSGPIGAVCSIGAAAFAWFAYLVSTTGSAAISQAVTQMQTAENTPTPEPAGDVDVETTAPADGPDAGEAALREEAADGLDDLQGYLVRQAPRPLEPAAPASSAPPRGDDGSSPSGDDGAAGPDSTLEWAEELADDPACAEEDGGTGGPPPELGAAVRRRAESAERRVARYFDQHPHTPTKTAAKHLAMDPKTVRKYRPRRLGGGR